MESAHSSAGERVPGVEVVRGELGRDRRSTRTPSPAQSIVSSARRAADQAQHIGDQARQRRAPTSTIVIVSCSEVWVVRAGGAHSATPMTPTTIAPIAMCSVAPGVLAEHPFGRRTSSTSRPIAERRLHDHQRRQQQRQHLQRPAEDRQPGAEQPARATEQAEQQRQPAGTAPAEPPWRPSPGGRSLGCRGSMPRPPQRFPSTRSTMSDDRSSQPRSTDHGCAGRGGDGGLRAPGPREPLRRRRPTRAPAPARRRSGSRTAPRSGRGFCAHLRRRPPPAGHARPCSRSSPATACRRPSSSSASRSAATPRSCARDARRRTRSIGLHCDRHRNLLRLTPRQVARTSPARRTRSPGATGLRDRRSTGRPTGCSTPPRWCSPARRGWRTLLWSHWGRDWQAHATPESIAARVTGGAGRGLGAAAARRRRLLGAGLVAAHGRGAAAGARPARRRGLSARRCRVPDAGATPVGSLTRARNRLTWSGDGNIVACPRPASPPVRRPARSGGALGQASRRPRYRQRSRWWVEALLIVWLVLGLRRDHQPRAAAGARGPRPRPQRAQPRALAGHRSRAARSTAGWRRTHARPGRLRLLRQRPLHRHPRTARLAVVGAGRHLPPAAQHRSCSPT